MNVRQQANKIAFLLLLFCIPFQTVSAAFIDCVHSVNNDCAMHHSSVTGDTLDNINTTDCAKCSLTVLLLSGYVLSEFHIQTENIVADYSVAANQYFYQLKPTPDSRPPRHLS